jgi:hypothetical protein
VQTKTTLAQAGSNRSCRLNQGKQRHMAITSQAIVDSVLKSIESSKRNDTPYRHWYLSHCLPEDALDAVLALPFEAPPLDGVSGKRELHNNTRKYFDADNMSHFPVCKAFNEAFQSKTVTDRVEEHFGTKLGGTYLRVEVAQDTDGFWLEPHSDLGVKLFTMLLYTSKDPSHADLGTDIYDAEKKPVGRSPFESNAALVFIPSDITFHGFERRKINGVRKSVIINYVSNEWRAREQLAFPNQPITP